VCYSGFDARSPLFRRRLDSWSSGQRCQAGLANVKSEAPAAWGGRGLQDSGRRVCSGTSLELLGNERVGRVAGRDGAYRFQQAHEGVTAVQVRALAMQFTGDAADNAACADVGNALAVRAGDSHGAGPRPSSR